MIFQDPMSALNPVHTVGCPARRGLPGPPRRLPPRSAAPGRWRRWSWWASRSRDRRADQFPHEFSGGMRQRAMIAMAVINDPRSDHRRRADDRARRHRPGPDPGDPPGGPGAHRRGDHDDHPRPGGRRGHRRPGAGDVRRNGGRVRPGGRGVRRAADAVHPRPARLGAASRAGRQAADARSRRATVAAATYRRACTFAPRCPLVAEVCREAEPALRRHGPPGPSARAATAGRSSPGSRGHTSCSPGARSGIRTPRSSRLSRRVPRTTGDGTAAGPRPGQALPGARPRRRAPHGGPGAGGLGRLAGRRRGRDRSGSSASPGAASRPSVGRSCSCTGRRRAPCGSRAAS